MLDRLAPRRQRSCRRRTNCRVARTGGCVLLLAVVLSLHGAPAAHAAEYPVAIVVDDEDDLNRLYHDGDITEEERDRLAALLGARVDLNRATREEIFELPGFTWQLADAVIVRRGRPGGIRDPRDLADLPGMTPAILQQALPFMTARAAREERRYEVESTTGGIGRYQGTSSTDAAFFERLRARAWSRAGLGVLVTVRPMLGEVQGAPSGGSLTATGYRTRPKLSHFYGYWDGPRFAALAGSYRVGYGLRLTLDNTGRLRPHGFYPNDDCSESADAGKLTPLDGFVGVAVRGKHVALGPGWLDLAAFGSYWKKDLYSADVDYDHGVDPFLVDRDTGDPIVHATLRDVILERLAGGNVTYRIDRRTAVGLTGYYGDFAFTVAAPEIMVVATSRYPEDRSAFGALGVNVVVGRGRLDAAAEAAVTDRGDPAALAVAFIEVTPDLHIVPSFRYYAPGYDNPYARGEAEADEYLGNRARDELGGRLQLVWRPARWLRLQGHANLYRHEHGGPVLDAGGDPAERPTVDLKTLLRADLYPTGSEQLALWFTHTDRDLERGGRALVYAGDDRRPGGMRLAWAASAGTARLRRVAVTAMVKQTLEDTGTFDDRFDLSWYAWLRVSAHAFTGSLIAARVTYHDELTRDAPPRPDNRRYCAFEEDGADLAGLPVPASCRGATYVSASVQATQHLPWLRGAARLRVEWQRFVDDRAKWRPLDPGDAIPPRHEILVKGCLAATF